MNRGSLMDKGYTLHGGARARMISIIWVIAAMLVLFAAESLWVGPWLRSKSPQMPSLIPDASSGPWFLALLVVAIFSVLLIVTQVLVALDRGIPLRQRMGTGLATCLALVLCVLWACVTSGMTSVHARKGHTVTLTWKASKSIVKGYNVYRGTKSGGPYTKVNSELVQGLTYQDKDVSGGTTYYYVTRSVDADYRESVNSGEITVTIP